MVLGWWNWKFNNRAYSWAPDFLSLHSTPQSMLESKWGDVGDNITRCWLQHWLSVRQSNSPWQTTLPAKKDGISVPLASMTSLASWSTPALSQGKCYSKGSEEERLKMGKSEKERTVRYFSMGRGELSCHTWNHTSGTPEQFSWHAERVAIQISLGLRKGQAMKSLTLATGGHLCSSRTQSRGTIPEVRCLHSCSDNE